MNGGAAETSGSPSDSGRKSGSRLDAEDGSGVGAVGKLKIGDWWGWVMD